MCGCRGGEKVALVAVGALTNVALLLLLYPEVIPMVDIVVMGGCMGIGNTGSVTEFNIQVSDQLLVNSWSTLGQPSVAFGLRFGL